MSITLFFFFFRQVLYCVCY